MQQASETQKQITRIILFGSEGGFSQPVLEKLLSDNRVSISAIVMPGVATITHVATGISIPVKQSPDLTSLAGFAAAQHIPIFRTARCDDLALVNSLSQLNADVFLVACFPLKLASKVLEIPKLACWNLHPSLLPKYRGPSPLYWQLKNNECNTGTTLHEVSDTLDAGDIVAQKITSLPMDHSSASIDAWVAKNGVDLFVAAIKNLQHGKLKKEPQIESDASYFPYPDQ